MKHCYIISETAKPWFTLYISRKNTFFYDFFLTCCLLSLFNILNQIPANIPAYFADTSLQSCSKRVSAVVHQPLLYVILCFTTTQVRD